MTPQEQEMRVKRQDILHRYRDEKSLETIDALRELESLDREAASKPANQFFDLVNEIDNTRKLLNAAQGNPTRIVMVLDMLTAVCVRYAEMLEK